MTTPPDLCVELLTSSPSEPFLTAWRALAVAAENPFASPDWLAAWLEVHADERAVIVGCRAADGRLVGVVGLVIDARGRLGNPGEPFADWFGPACAPEDETAVAIAATAALHDARHLGRTWIMSRCLTGGGWLEGLRRSRHPEYDMVATDSETELSQVRFSGEPAMSGKDRREIKRLLRRLTDEHEVAFRCARTPAEAEAAYPVFERLHAARWPELREAGGARFHRDFAHRAAEHGWLRLWTLEVDGEAAAVLYGWRLGKRSFAYMQSFDPAFGRHGVGILLLAHAVAAAEEEGSEVFDMLRGQERHKARFENEQRIARTFVVVGRGSVARVVVRSREAARGMYWRMPEHRRATVRQILTTPRRLPRATSLQPEVRP